MTVKKEWNSFSIRNLCQLENVEMKKQSNVRLPLYIILILRPCCSSEREFLHQSHVRWVRDPYMSGMSYANDKSFEAEPALIFISILHDGAF